MATELTAIVVRSERRVRLIFSQPLAVGAFGVSPSLYTITSLDGLGADPSVSAALVIPNAPDNVELALSAALVPNGRYQLVALGVPGQDLTFSTSLSTQTFTIHDNFVVADREPEVSDVERRLFGSDLVWTGEDFEEDAYGDLASVEGPANAVAAINRRIFANGLPWDPDYGVNPRDYVDATRGSGVTLKGRILNQCLRDDRVKDVKVQYIDLEDEDPVFETTVTLIGNRQAKPISMVVP